MPIDILATGDNHFDERSPRWDECLRVHARIVEIARARRPSLVMLGGDLYERASTPLERREASDFVRSLADVAPVLGVRGNHDAPLDVANLSALRAKHPIQFVEDARVVEVAGVSVACLAWPTRAGAIDDGVAREQLRDVLRGLGAELEGHAHRVLLGHLDIDGAVTGAGQPLIGGSLRVALSDLALARAQLAIASHVHRAQAWQHGDMPVTYCGSPFRHDFGEVDPKSVLHVTIDGDRVSYERIDTGARPMLLVTSHWNAEMGHFEETDVDLLPPRVESADVRFRYTVDADRREVARSAAAERRDQWLAAGAATVQLEPEVIATVRARAPEVAAARTLPEQLQALWKAKNDVPEPARATRLLSRLAQLEQETTAP